MAKVALDTPTLPPHHRVLRRPQVSFRLGYRGLSPAAFSHFDFTKSVLGHPVFVRLGTPCHFPFFPFVRSLGFGQTQCEGASPKL